MTAVTISSSLYCPNNAADSDSPLPAVITAVALFRIALSLSLFFFYPSALQNYSLISLVSHHHPPIQLLSVFTVGHAERQASVQLASGPPDVTHASEPPFCIQLIIVISFSMEHNEFSVIAWCLTRSLVHHGSRRARLSPRYKLCVS